MEKTFYFVKAINSNPSQAFKRTQLIAHYFPFFSPQWKETIITTTNIIITMRKITIVYLLMVVSIFQFHGKKSKTTLKVT